MATFANKTIIILFFALRANVFADMGTAFTAIHYPEVSIRYDTSEVKIIRAEKRIHSSPGNWEIVVTKHDKEGKLIFYRKQIFKAGLLVQIIENGETRYIISGETECDFKIIEFSGDTISFKLDPNKEPKWQSSLKYENIVFSRHLKIPKVLSKDKYEDIIDNWWDSSCRFPKDFSTKLEIKRKNDRISD